MSLDVVNRCGVCRSYLDDDDLFCANCGTENPLSDTEAKRLEHAPSHHRFECQGCGASMSYDASAQALRCPFCGDTRMQSRPAARGIVPNRVAPLEVTQAQAEKRLRGWLGNGFWRPSDAASASTIGSMTAVYVPYWVFEAETDTMWTADSSPAPPGSRGDWYPVSGDHRARYPGILVSGSSVLTPRETDAIAPFHLDRAVRPDAIDLTNEIVEEFKVPRKVARPLARGAIEGREIAACQRLVPNRSRHLKVNVKIAAMHGHPVLLPVWILAYRYRDDVHRVLINGQTGKIAGSAPFSQGKLVAVVAIAAAVIALLFLLLVLAGGLR